MFHNNTVIYNDNKFSIFDILGGINSKHEINFKKTESNYTFDSIN